MNTEKIRGMAQIFGTVLVLIPHCNGLGLGQDGTEI
jgi:hypothetical protein